MTSIELLEQHAEIEFLTFVPIYAGILLIRPAHDQVKIGEFRANLLLTRPRYW